MPYFAGFEGAYILTKTATFTECFQFFFSNYDMLMRGVRSSIFHWGPSWKEALESLDGLSTSESLALEPGLRRFEGFYGTLSDLELCPIFPDALL